MLELILGKGEAPSAYCRRWGFDFHTAGDVRGLVDASDFQDSSPRHRDQRTFSRVPAETVPHDYQTVQSLEFFSIYQPYPWRIG